MELACLIVNVGALRANYRLLADAAPCAAAVVKADGYGLGAVRVLQALRQEGCEDFFVATVEEGLRLRGASCDERIYVFSGPIDDDSAQAMASHSLTPVLNDREQVRLWQPHRRLPVAVHVDTGMNRLGFACDELRAELLEPLNVSLLLSHLAHADDPSHPMNATQIDRFEGVAAMFPGVRTSFGNSGGILLGAASDMARPGIALYGGSPFATAWNPMRPVATLLARVLALRDVGAGEAVGYGAAYVAAAPIRVAVIGIGYADGVTRRLQGGEVAYRGVRLPIIGRISMDLLHVDESAVAESLALGDWVEIFGKAISLEEAATWAGTVNYEVLTSIGARVRRCYVDG